MQICKRHFFKPFSFFVGNILALLLVKFNLVSVSSL